MDEKELRKALEIHLDVYKRQAKDCVDYQCRRCGQCCRHIKDAVMVESMDAYRLANYLRGCDPNICTIDDVLTRYCEPMPLTQECFPIFMLKTTGQMCIRDRPHAVRCDPGTDWRIARRRSEDVL